MIAINQLTPYPASSSISIRYPIKILDTIYFFFQIDRRDACPTGGGMSFPRRRESIFFFVALHLHPTPIRW